MELIIVTGLSGAGKSHAANCLEDLGFYCVDNMPPKLMSDFLRLAEDKGEFQKIAFVTDVRGGHFFGDLNAALDELKGAGRDYKIIFLEASTPVLVRRYKETRRSHPMAPQGDIEAGIEKEREKLADIKRMASVVIDTSDKAFPFRGGQGQLYLKHHELRLQVRHAGRGGLGAGRAFSVQSVLRSCS